MRTVLTTVSLLFLFQTGLYAQAQQSLLTLENQPILSSQAEAFLYGPYATPLDLEFAAFAHRPASAESNSSGLMLDCSGSGPCRWVSPGMTPALQTHSNARNQVESPDAFVRNQMNPADTPEQEAKRRLGDFLFNRVFRRSN